ncbi:MAG: toprim domain-containing protein [Bacteroidetes bacterium]|nr:toprim domain-containing protein [Bacteroidota bacterium]
MKKNDFDCFHRHNISRYFEITKINALQNKTLIDYIEMRGIPSQIAALYVKEAIWKHPYTQPMEVKRHYGITVKNDSGGYDMSYGGKDWSQTEQKKPYGMTTFPGNKSGLNIFEDIYDFLSFLTIYKIKETPFTSIILNEHSPLHKLYKILPEYELINLYLDNDQVGLELTNKIQRKYPQAVNCSGQIYPEYKTFNDFLLKKKISPQVTNPAKPP